jgi:hypothetical protein
VLETIAGNGGRHVDTLEKFAANENRIRTYHPGAVS